MKRNRSSRSGLCNPRTFFAFALCSFGVLLAMFSFAATPSRESTRVNAKSPHDSILEGKPTNQLSSNAPDAPVGVWSIVPSPSVNSNYVNRHLAVACSSQTACWAVGYYYGGSNQQTLIERWDGTAWAVVSSPNPSATEPNWLNAVTCVSASDCWAVGFSGYQGKTLIERWDGTSWAVIPSPNPSGAYSSDLNDVTCASALDCWAVGYYYNLSARRTQTLIEHWDGTSWTIFTSPNASATEDNFLYGVTCTLASDCWAVGEYYSRDPIHGYFVTATLIEHWDGTSWTIVISPNSPIAQSSTLYDVTCASALDCWAVGNSYDSETTHIGYQTLVERWNGVSWTIIPSPNTTSPPWNVLESVTCASASNCWAVGYLAESSGGSPIETLILQWNGALWTIVPSPNTSATEANHISYVTCASATECWAVGTYGYPGGQTLVMRYLESPPPIPTSVVSRKTHGTAGDFNIDLPLTGTPAIECRSGAANNDYQIVFTFPSAVTVSGAAATPWTGGSASVAGLPSTSPDGKEVTVNLTNVSSAQTITVTLIDVNDGTTTGDAAVAVSLLLGDTNANRAVNSSDISQTKAQSGMAADATNFRTDVTVNGLINSSDISIVKSKSGTALP
jgi:hypothetical protein